MFKELIKIHHPVSRVSSKNKAFEPTYEELNGIRYVAGWVIRSVSKKINKSSNPLKKDLSICLFHLVDDTDDILQESSEWVNAVDRGGLTRVNNATFQLFLAVENEFRSLLSAAPASCNPTECAEGITANEAVQCVWSSISVDWTKSCAETLLEMIVSEWVKIRGFSETSMYMETLKFQQQKTTQKSKGLRKQLQSAPKMMKKDEDD